jgi:hypothetical protein
MRKKRRWRCGEMEAKICEYGTARLHSGERPPTAWSMRKRWRRESSRLGSGVGNKVVTQIRKGKKGRRERHE